MKNISNIQNIKHKILGIISVIAGVCAVFAFTLFNNNPEILNILEKPDTLTFLLQDQKQEAEESRKNQNIFADFITPTINKYDGPVTESMLTCMDGYDTEKIKNIYSYEKLNISEGAVSVKVEENAKPSQTSKQIKNEIMPIFGHAVKKHEINWKFDRFNKTYTFETYKGDEALWYCYLRKETRFFTEFFNITEEEQVDPLPPISQYRIEEYGHNIFLDWDYDYSKLGYMLKNDSLQFIIEYKKHKEDDSKWKQSKEIGYPQIIFEEKKSEDDGTYYWGEPIEYGYQYDIRLKVKSDVYWYKDSKYLEFSFDTTQLQYPYDIDDVAKINTSILVNIYANKTEDENGDGEYKFYPKLEEEDGNAFVNIYDKKTGIKKYTKNLYISELDKKYINENTGEEEHAYQIKKEIKIDEPGVYSSRICFGKTAENCEEYGLSSEIEILNFTCNEVFAGHNVKDADRINIVFIGSRYRKFSDFLLAVRESLTWDGKPAVLSRFDEESQSDKVYDLDWGFFAIEPFKSNKDKFNIWYVDEPMTTLTNYADNLCGLPYEYDAIYANRSFLGMLGRTRSFTYLARFGEDRSKGTPEKMFSSSHNYMPYDEFGSHALDYELFAHETGHAVFGLQDEYDEGNDHAPRYGKVSCAKDQDEAEEWWGNLIGEVDPFFDEVKADMIKYDVNSYTVSECKRDNQDAPESEENPCLKDENENYIYIDVEKEKYPESYFKTQYFKGGCLADYGDERVIKPTEHSLMSYNIPILGSVNRQEVERILNMFTGE